jgi:dTDP-glucose pyrophosphorylase
MKDFKKHLINHRASILEAMEAINKLDSALTLFVCDDNDKLIGTVTDGDIRRGLLRGKAVNMSVAEYTHATFKSIKKNDINVKHINDIKESGIELLPILDDHGRIFKVHDFKKRMSLLPLECVIMAGGKGKRLKPLTDTMPKPMLRLGKKPIIEHNIDRLIQFGIEKIYISINYLGEHIREYFGDGSGKGISIEYIEEDIPLGTAGSLSLVDKFSTDYVLLMNSDLFTDINFEDLFLEVINTNAEMGIASIPYTVSIPYAILERDNNVITSFKEKPNHTHYANAGIYIFKKKWIDKIPKNTFYNITDLITELLNLNKTIIHDPIVGYWIDIGKPDDFKKAQEIAKHINYN